MTDPLPDTGLPPLHAEQPGDTDPIATRTYRHPQPGSQAVTRLAGQAIAPAEDIAEGTT